MHKLAHLKMHLATILFGSSSIFGVLISSSSQALVLGRLIVAFIIISLIFVAKKIKPWQSISLKCLFSLILSSFLLASHWVTFYLSVKLGGVAISTFGFACFPAFTFILEALVFKQKFTLFKTASVVLVIIGIYFLGGDFNLENSVNGLLVGILSAFIYAVLAINNRNLSQKMSSFVLSWWQYVIGIFLLLPIGFSDLAKASLTDLFWILCLGVFCTFIAYALFMSSLRQISAHLAAVIISLEPIYAVIMAYFIFGDTLPANVFLGGALIISAVIFANYSKSSRK